MVFTIGLTISGLTTDNKIDNVATNSDLVQTYISIKRQYPVCGYFIYKQFQGHGFIFYICGSTHHKSILLQITNVMAA